MFGLSHSDPDQTYTSNQYGLFLQSNGSVQVYESGVLRGTFGTYAVGDKFSVEVDGGTTVR